jgi:hypothetical protein
LLEGWTHQIAIPDVNGDYSSTDKPANQRHWECGIPLERCYRRDIHHLLHNLPGIRSGNKHNATLAATSKIITVWGKTQSCDRANVSAERFCVLILASKHEVWQEGVEKVSVSHKGGRIPNLHEVATIADSNTDYLLLLLF